MQTTINPRTLRKFAAKFQPVGDEFPATLGLDNGTIDVPDRDGYSYAIASDNRVIEAWRESVPPVWRLPVIIGTKHGRLTVLRIWDTLALPPSTPPMREHARSHKYLKAGDPAGTGYDWTPIEDRQIMPLRVQVDNSTMNVSVEPGIVQLEGEWVYFPGDETYSMSASIPASGARYSLLSIYNVAGVATLYTTDGTETDFDLLTVNDAPPVPNGHYPLAIIRLYVGQTALEESIYNADILDGRFFGTGSSTIPQVVPPLIKSGNYTLLATDHGKVVVFTATATATLPNDPPAGTTYRICCRAGTLTIDGDSSDTIKGNLTVVLNPGDDLILCYTATGVWE